MSEEEIIEEVEKELKLAKNIDDVATTIRNEYIEGLLDLYQQEKEKNEILEDTLNNSIDIRKYWISKDKIKELREIDNIDLIQFKIRELLEERN